MYIKNSFTDPVFHHKLSVQTLLRPYFSRSKIGAPVGAKAEAFELMCIVWPPDPSDQRIMHYYAPPSWLVVGLWEWHLPCMENFLLYIALW